jgi:hypothetical protein
MRIPESILDAVTTFHTDWRHPRLAPLEYSDVYSLFPQETSNTPTNANWPDNWPLADRAGVYLIFGARMQLLYVGKSPTLGTRLSSYFRWSAGKGTPCRVVHTAWKTRPMFVATIAVTESFEAAALEEYLIGRLHPEENYLLLTSPDSSSDSVSFSSWSTIKSSRRTHVTARCFYSQRCLETQVVSRLPRSALGAGFHAKHLDDPNSDQIGFSTSGEFAN